MLVSILHCEVSIWIRHYTRTEKRGARPSPSWLDADGEVFIITSSNFNNGNFHWYSYTLRCAVGTKQEWDARFIFSPPPGFSCLLQSGNNYKAGIKEPPAARGQGIKLYLLFTASNEYLRNASRPSLVFNSKYQSQVTSHTNIFLTEGPSLWS